MTGDLFDDRARWERLESITIERLQLFEPEDGYILAYSGGKDSDVLLSLTRAAGVRFEAHYHATTIDPPEVVRHVLAQPDVTLDRPKRSMVRLIAEWGLPSRGRRWCCKELKEHPFPGRVVLTGVRAAESSRRARRSMVEPARAGKGQRFAHLLFDWADADVWGYLRGRGVPYCRLYDENFKRIGCICCPMASGTQERDVERWPHIVAAMHRAFLRYVAKRAAKGDPILQPDRFWQRFVTGDWGGEKAGGCPLFADVRDS